MLWASKINSYKTYPILLSLSAVIMVAVFLISNTVQVSAAPDGTTDTENYEYLADSVDDLLANPTLIDYDPRDPVAVIKAVSSGIEYDYCWERSDKYLFGEIYDDNTSSCRDFLTNETATTGIVIQVGEFDKGAVGTFTIDHGEFTPDGAGGVANFTNVGDLEGAGDIVPNPAFTPPEIDGRLFFTVDPPSAAVSGETAINGANGYAFDYCDQIGYVLQRDDLDACRNTEFWIETSEVWSADCVDGVDAIYHFGNQSFNIRIINQNPQPEASCVDPDTQGQLEIGCRAENFGWAICPVVDGVLWFVGFMAGLIANFLEVPPIQLDSDGDTYEIWQIFRNISLSLLVVAMLIMVFGQAMSLNIDAYTVKKMLPRIVIASIGIMLSIYIAAFAVDLFNVLGSGVQALVTAPFGDMNVFVGSFGDFSATLLAGIASGAIIVGLGMAGFMLVVLIPVAMAFLAVYLTLVLRQIVIIMLIIIAPLAFVAWTIPGTEKYFKMWSTTFIKALVMYPLIMLLLASGKIFAVIVTTVPNGQPGWINTLTALVAMALPLFLVPATFKMAGGAIAMGAGAMANMQNKYKQRLADPNDRLGRNLKKHRELHDQKKDTDRSLNAMGLNKKATDGKLKRGYRRVRQYGAAGSLLATGAGRGALNKNVWAAIGQTEEEMNAQMQKNPHAFKSYLMHGATKGGVEKEAARLRTNGNEAQAQQLENLAGTFGYGNQAAAGAMLMSMGRLGKLSNDAIDGAAAMYGATRHPDGRRMEFSADQASAVATFSNIATQAGFAASAAPIAQSHYKNLAVVKASTVGASGGGFVVDRNGNVAAADVPAAFFTPVAGGYGAVGNEKADWETFAGVPSPERMQDKAIDTMASSIVKHVNHNPSGAREQAAVKGAARALHGYGSTPESMESWQKVVDNFDGGATATQVVQLDRIAQAQKKVDFEQANAKAKGYKTSANLVRAQSDLATAQAAMAGGPTFVRVASQGGTGSEYVRENSARHEFLKEFNRGGPQVIQAGP